MDMATDADINIEHRLTEVEQRAKSNTNRLNEHDEILKSNSEMIGAIKELATEVKYMRGRSRQCFPQRAGTGGATG